MGRSRPVLACLAAVSALAGTALALGSPAAAASSGVVLNEVYGGGGNIGAAFHNDFVELSNRGTTTQDLTGWSVQYQPSSGTGTWQSTPLSGSIAAGSTFLIGESAGTGTGATLPTPDATGAINLSGSAGTVALVDAAAPLTCHSSADCTGDSTVIDLVGYGSAAVKEGADAPSPADNATSVARTSAADSDDNAADFTTGAPTPTPASGGTGGGGTEIHDIQGAGFVSPLDGQTVQNVPGIVTAVRAIGASKGYWMQDATPDGNPATSEGIFVYTGSTPTVSVGDAVTVNAKVSDYYPGGAPSTNSNLSVTELGSAITTVVSSGNPLPDAVVLSGANIPSQYAPDLGGRNIENTTLQPSRSALDFYESLEGMRVEVDDARVVGPTNSYGETYVTAIPDQAKTYRGGTELLGENQIPSGRLELIPNDGTNLGADVRDVLAGPTIGAMDYSQFGGYTIAAQTVGTLDANNLQRTVATPGANRQLSIATYNVENLAPSDDDSKYAALAAGIVTNLRSPDVVAVEEVQDNSGSTDNGVVAADQTLTKLTAAIAAAGGPNYQWREIDPVDDQDGGQPGGNIRTVFLFNGARVSFVDSGSAGVNRSTAGTTVTNTNGAVGLSLSPGRIDPTNPVWSASRKPLVGQFRFGGQDVFVVANHFDSKGGDQNADGRFQYPARSSEVQRAGQAAAVHQFVQSILAVKSGSEVVVLGDLNDYQFSPALNILKTGTADGAGPANLTDLITTLPIDEQYTYVYNGISQVLDHILVTKRIKAYTYQVVHLNSEFHDQVSDHDPQVVQFRP